MQFGRKRAVRYMVEMHVDRVFLEVRFPCRVSVAWRRGKKLSESQSVELKKGVAHLDTRLSLPVNIYYQDEKLMPKKTVFTVLIHTESGVKIAGTVSFNPSDYISSSFNTQQTFKIQRCPDKEARFTGTFHSRLVCDIELDKISHASGNSNACNPCASGEQPVRLREQAKIDVSQVRRQITTRINLQQRSSSLNAKDTMRNEMLLRENQTLSEALKRISQEGSQTKFKEMLNRVETQKRTACEEKQVLRGRVEQLEQMLLSRQQDYSSRMHQLQLEVSSLKERSSQKENVNADLAERVRRLEKERGELCERLSRVSAEDHLRSSDMTKQIEELSLLVKRYEVRDQLYRQQLAKLGQLNSKVSKERQDYEERARAERQHLLSLHRQESSSYDQKLKALQTRLRQKQTLIAEFQARASTSTTKLQQLQIGNNQKIKRIRTLEEALREKERVSEEARLASQQLRRQLERKQALVQQAERRVSSLTLTLTNLQSQKNSLAASLNQHCKQSQKMQSGKVTLEVAIRNFEKRYAELQAEQRTTSKRLHSFVECIGARLSSFGMADEKDSDGAMFEQRFTRIQRFLDQLYQKKQMAESELINYKAEISRLQTLLKDSDSRLLLKEVQYRDLQTVIELMKAEAETTRRNHETALSQFQRELLECVRINENLRAQYAAVYKNYNSELDCKLMVEKQLSETVMQLNQVRDKTVRSLQYELRGKHEMIERLRADTSATRLQGQIFIKDSQDKIQRLQFEESRLKKLVAELEEKVRFLDATSQQLRKQKVSLERSKSDYESELRRWQEQNKSLGELKIRASSQSFFKDKTISDLTRALSQAQKQLNLKNVSLQSRHEELLQLKQALFQKEAMIVSLGQKLNFRGAPSKELEQQYKMRIARLQKQLEDKDLELRRRLANTQQSDKLRETVRLLQQQLVSLQEQLFSYSSREHQIAAREQSLHHQLNQLGLGKLQLGSVEVAKSRLRVQSYGTRLT